MVRPFSWVLHDIKLDGAQAGGRLLVARLTAQDRAILRHFGEESEVEEEEE